MENNDHYAFFLHFSGGGYVYFTAYTIFNDFGRHRREIRSPDATSKLRFTKVFESLDARFLVVENRTNYDRWLNVRGWALVEKEFVRRYMPQWLASRECIAAPSGALIDCSAPLEVGQPIWLIRRRICIGVGSIGLEFCS